VAQLNRDGSRRSRYVLEAQPGQSVADQGLKLCCRACLK
jgi:hypothetical protein